MHFIGHRRQGAATAINRDSCKVSYFVFINQTAAPDRSAELVKGLFGTSKNGVLWLTRRISGDWLTFVPWAEKQEDGVVPEWAFDWSNTSRLLTGGRLSWSLLSCLAAAAETMPLLQSRQTTWTLGWLLDLFTPEAKRNIFIPISNSNTKIFTIFF